MQLEDRQLAEITRLLSMERLRTFLSLAGSAHAAVDLHQKTVRIAGTLMCVTAILEISLRNAVCDQLTAYFGTLDWLRHPRSPFSWRHQENAKIGEARASAQRAAYAKMNSAAKHELDARLFPKGVPAHLSHEQHMKVRQQAIVVPTGQIIAKLTLFFWKRLFSQEYEHVLWRPALKRVFPDKVLKRADVALQLERIYQTRNRIAHHEPVYGRRLEEAITAIDFVIERLGSPHAHSDTPLARLLSDDRTSLLRQADSLSRHREALSAI